MAADDLALEDHEAALALARFIREHIDSLVEASLRAYEQDYPFSTRGGVDDQVAARWTTSEYTAMADQLEMGSIDADQYRSVGGDMVIQHERLLYPIDAFLEWCLFGAHIIASAIWRETVGDTRTTNRLLAQLTPHETSMARLVGQGLSNAQVASSMNVSISTVKNTMSRVYVKLGIGSRVELVRMLSQVNDADLQD